MATSSSSNSLRNRTLIVVFGTVLLLGLFLFLNGGERGWDWSYSLDPNSNQPYGAGILHTLLPDYLDGEVSMVEEPLTELGFPETLGSYLFLGYEPRFQPGEIDSLLQWVAAGHTALFAAPYWADSLCSAMSASEPDHDVWRSHRRRALYLQFMDEGMALPEPHVLHRRIRDRRPNRNWFLIDTGFLFWSFPGARPLIMAEEGCPLLRLDYGEGKLLFLTTNELLSNRSLSEAQGRDVAERILSYLPPGDLYWDRGFRPQLGGAPPPPNSTPLRFVLQNEALRKAWYMLLALLLLYVLFRSRRRQAAIPLVGPKENHSLAFVDSIAELHVAQRGGHADALAMLQNHFYDAVLRRFQINLRPQRAQDGSPVPADPAQARQQARALALRADLEPEEVESLMRLVREAGVRPAKAGESNDYGLIRLHQRLQAFYQHIDQR